MTDAPDPIWRSATFTKAYRVRTRYRRGYARVSAGFLLCSLVGGTAVIIAQHQHLDSAANRELSYQRQVASTITRDYGLTATDLAQMPIADHDSSLADFAPTSSAPDGLHHWCTVTTGDTPDEVTVTCPDSPTGAATQ